MRDPAEGPLGLPFLRRGNVNDLDYYCDTVNLGLTKKDILSRINRLTSEKNFDLL